MANYKVGTLKIADTVSGLIIQDCSISTEADEAQVKDENGNVAYLQYYNHRAVANINAVVPKGAAIPVIGATVGIKGVTLPEPAADGSMENTAITLDDSSDVSVDFVITSSQISTSNSDVDKYSLTATRFLENKLGAVKTASA